MLTVLLIMLAGMIFGYVFRNREDIIKHAEPLLTYSIYLLLLLIGISVGLNKLVMSRLDTIGIQSLVLTLAGVLGSCIASYFCYILFFKNKEKK
jgi:uncharacterized membrane protein YbjE (DUF340 family)